MDEVVHPVTWLLNLFGSFFNAPTVYMAMECFQVKVGLYQGSALTVCYGYRSYFLGSSLGSCYTQMKLFDKRQ